MRTARQKIGLDAALLNVGGGLLIALFAHHCEKFLVKYIPGILKSVFVGMLMIVITFTFGITILGPFGDMVGAQVVHIFVFASEHFRPIAIGLLAGFMSARASASVCGQKIKRSKASASALRSVV